MKLSVIYRACGTECGNDLKADRPSWFSKEKCWFNFIREFDFIDTHVVWDGPENGLSEKMKSTKHISFHHVNYQNNQKSLLHCYHLASHLDADSIYFLEDDYLHRKDSKFILLEGLSQFGFVSLYDHPDRYTIGYSDISYGKEHIFMTKSSHWRTAESTTCSVAIRKDIFNQVKNLFIKHCEDGVGAPNDRPLYRELMMIYGLRLFTPIPGYSTHCVEKYLSPFGDWGKTEI